MAPKTGSLSILRAVDGWLRIASPRRIFILCLLLAGILGWIDYVTGHEYSFSIF